MSFHMHVLVAKVGRMNIAVTLFWIALIKKNFPLIARPAKDDDDILQYSTDISGGRLSIIVNVRLFMWISDILSIDVLRNKNIA